MLLCRNWNCLKTKELTFIIFTSPIFTFSSTDQSLNCLQFVDWCVNNYSFSERVIMDINNSTILCHVNSLVVQKTVLVPDEFTLKSKNYNDESIVQCFRESTIEKKQDFFKKCFKPDVESSNQSFPVDAKKPSMTLPCYVSI